MSSWWQRVAIVLASLERLGAIAVKELLQLRRDRVSFGMVIMMPLMQLILFGYGINTDVRQVPIVLVDNAQTAFSRQLAQSLQASQVVHISHSVTLASEARALITQGKVVAGLIIPADTEQRYYSGQLPVAQLLVDGSDTMVASSLSLLRSFPFKPDVPATNADALNMLEVQLLYNPERRAAMNTVPGLVGIILTMTMGLFTSIAIVREREAGNLEFLIATPVRNSELMIGKITPYILIGLLQVLLILGMGKLLFNVPMGNPVTVLVTSLVFVVANLSLGLLISTVAPNQLGAMQIFMMLMIPTILLSGFMFPYVAMPDVVQWISELLPATHFMRIIRGVVLREAGIGDVLPDLFYLMAFSVVVTALATRLFNRRLD
jgi:ABC-2 type transport system permease protein